MTGRILLLIFLIFSIQTFAAVVPDAGKSYFIVQSAVRSAKVIGTSAFNEVVLQDASDSKGQQFEFIAVQGKTDVYYLRNAAGLFLLNSFDVQTYTEYGANPDPGFAEWKIEGDDFRNIRLKSVTGNYLGTADYSAGAILLCDKVSADEGAVFGLMPVNTVIKQGLVDPDFENAYADGSPLGTWIPDKDAIKFGTYGYSRVQSQNGWACTGNNAFYLRFLGDASSYNSISYQISNLIPGAVCKLGLQYKCQSTSTTALVSVYAATTPNALRSAAIGGVFATTSVAATNLPSQVPQSITLNFRAPASTVWIVFAKNTIATNFNFFIDNLSLSQIIPSGLNNAGADEKLKAYVSEGKIALEYDGNVDENTQVQIFDVAGKPVYAVSGKHLFINRKLVAAFNAMPGIYFIRVRTASETCKTSIVL